MKKTCAVVKHAVKYGVTKRAVTNLAGREDWQRRLAEIEAKAREEADKKRTQTLEVVYEQHMTALRLVFGKGVEALKGMAIDTPADAMKAIQLVIREMRVALGEPTDRTAISVEDTIRKEYQRWMTVENDGAEDSAAG